MPRARRPPTKPPKPLPPLVYNNHGQVVLLPPHKLPKKLSAR